VRVSGGACAANRPSRLAMTTRQQTQARTEVRRAVFTDDQMFRVRGANYTPHEQYKVSEEFCSAGGANANAVSEDCVRVQGARSYLPSSTTRAARRFNRRVSSFELSYLGRIFP